jgi:hypothetical protein
MAATVQREMTRTKDDPVVTWTTWSAYRRVRPTAELAVLVSFQHYARSYENDNDSGEYFQGVPIRPIFITHDQNPESIFTLQSTDGEKSVNPDDYLGVFGGAKPQRWTAKIIRHLQEGLQWTRTKSSELKPVPSVAVATTSRHTRPRDVYPRHHSDAPAVICSRIGTTLSFTILSPPAVSSQMFKRLLRPMAPASAWWMGQAGRGKGERC